MSNVGRGTLQLSGRSDETPVPAIGVTGLVKRYGQVRAVNGIDLEIAPGEVVALLGPNGAGKSTFVDMVLGLTTPDEGSVRIFGRAPRSAVTSGDIGAMLQEGGIVEDATIRELVTMFAGTHRSPLSVDEVLTAMDIADIADRRGKLSGGQRQRLRLAIALVCNPRVLLLDEPTAAMDVGSRHTFWAFMREFIGTDRTVVFATHYLEEAEEFADRVVLLQGGTIIADGSVAEIRSVVAGRTLSAVVPGATLDGLTALPGVVTGETRGERFELVCADSDQAARALFASFPAARDVEIGAIGLEQAFLALTARSTDREKAAGRAA